jgi:serine/threonine protein kinase
MSSNKSSVQKSDFHIVKVIGRGSYGKVYLVRHNELNEYYAMKSVKKELVIKTD